MVAWKGGRGGGYATFSSKEGVSEKGGASNSYVPTCRLHPRPLPIDLLSAKETTLKNVHTHHLMMSEFPF